MTVDTRRAARRRYVHYADFDAFLAEAERLAAMGAETTGNWSLAQIFDHLARSMSVAVHGTKALFPLPARFVLRLLRKRIISGPLKPGFNCPRGLAGVLKPAEDIETAEGLQRLRAAARQFQKAPALATHPAFGRLTRGEWDRLTLRHAELHMSFVVAD
jgi:Protein of unknown function (DUF1569)